MPENRVRPRNRPARTMTMAAMVPNTEANVELMKATFRVTQAASRKARLLISSTYHFVLNPAQTVTSLLSLKLKMMRITIGR